MRNLVRSVLISALLGLPAVVHAGDAPAATYCFHVTLTDASTGKRQVIIDPSLTVATGSPASLKLAQNDTTYTLDVTPQCKGGRTCGTVRADLTMPGGRSFRFSTTVDLPFKNSFQARDASGREIEVALDIQPAAVAPPAAAH